MFGWVDDDMGGLDRFSGPLVRSFDNKRSEIKQPTVTLNGVPLLDILATTLDILSPHPLFVLGWGIADELLRLQPIPEHVGHLIPRTQIGVGVPVTVQTPGHAQRLRLCDHFHLVDTTVTGGTSHTRRDVNFVVEVSVVGQHVHIDPTNRLVLLVAQPHLRKLLAVGQHLCVAPHTDLRRRNGRVAGLVDRVVTVATVQPKRSCMEFVTKRNRLLGSVTDVRKFGRKPVPDAKNSKQAA